MKRIVSADYQELLAENTPKVVSELKMQPTTIEAYFDGMTKVVNESGGTGYNAQWSLLPATVAGKTGTAQQFWGASDNAAFVCFAPVDDPEIAIAIYVEKGAHGSDMATIAWAVLSEYFNVGTVSDVTVYENYVS